MVSSFWRDTFWASPPELNTIIYTMALKKYAMTLEDITTMWTALAGLV
jgi:hypothetical protein